MAINSLIILVLIFMLGATCFIIFRRNPLVLAICFIFILPLDNLILLIGDGKLRFAEIFGLIFFILMVLYKYQKKIPSPAGFGTLVALIIYGICVVFLRLEHLSKGLQMEAHIAILAVSAYVIYCLFLIIPDYQQAENIVTRVVVFFLFIGLLQFCVYYFTGVNLGYIGEYDLGGGSKLAYGFWSQEPGVGRYTVEDVPWFRASSLFREPVYLGMLGSWFFAVSIFRFLFHPEKKWLWRLLLAGAAVIISASRAAMLACLFSFFATIFFLSPRHRLRTILMTLVMLLTMFFSSLLVDHGVGELFEGRLDISYTEKDLRWLMYLAQIDGFLQHPLIGNSPGATEAVIRAAVPDTWEPENIPSGGYSTFLTLLHDEGLVGLGLFLAFLIKIYQEAIKTLKINQVGLPPRGASFSNGLLAMLVWSILGPGLGMGLFWLGVALAWAFIKKDSLLIDTYRRQGVAL